MRDSSDDDQGEIWSVSTWSFEACHGGKRLLPKMLLCVLGCVITIIVQAITMDHIGGKEFGESFLHCKIGRSCI